MFLLLFIIKYNTEYKRTI